MTKIKMTKARKRIMELFKDDCKPLNAEAISQKLNKEMDRVTVYRTLTLFVQAGLLNQVDLRKDSVYYELTSHHHHHIICTDCGVVEGFESCKAEDISEHALKSSHKFKIIRSHSLELFGLCNTCAKG
jgi:Fur family transcriptional regulator, ferric uptake regulator